MCRGLRPAQCAACFSVASKLAAAPNRPPKTRFSRRCCPGSRSSLRALAANPVNHGLLDAIQIPEPVRADYRRDYQPLLGLGLERFAVVGSD